MSIPQRMRAAVLHDVNDVRIEERPVPKLSEGEMLVRTRAGGICSSDVMGWYVKRKAPFVLGHEPAGTVVALGPGPAPRALDGRAFAPGDAVFVHHHAPCLGCRFCERGDYVQCATWRASRIDPGGVAEYFRVPRENIRDTLRLPGGMRYEDASLIEPLACVVKSLRRGNVRPGDVLYVIGLGVMGLMHVLAGLALGARVFGSDFIANRRDFAQRLGASAFHPDQFDERLATGADVTVCGPGTPAAMRAAIATTAPGGTVVMFTPFEPGAPLELDPERVYFKDLRVVGSYSCGPDDTQAALRMIAGGTVSAEKLGATLVSLDETPRAYRELAASTIIKPIVVLPAST